MKKSKIGKFDWKDAGKGLFIAVLSTVLAFVLEIIKVQGLQFESGAGWEIATMAVTATLVYVIKNFLTNNNDEMFKSNISVADETVKKR